MRKSYDGMECVVDGCRRRPTGRNLCNKHYVRWFNTGVVGDPLKPTSSERFWSKVDKSGNCWVWKSGRDRVGYPHFYFHGRTLGAHRVSYELTHGKIPAGMLVDHICFNKRCVRPSHLRIVTQKQNQEHLQGARTDSTTGIRGVNFDQKNNRWCAQVFHNGQTVHAGRFKTKPEAEAAAIALRNELFTHNDLDRVKP